MIDESARPTLQEMFDWLITHDSFDDILEYDELFKHLIALSNILGIPPKEHWGTALDI